MADNQTFNKMQLIKKNKKIVQHANSIKEHKLIRTCDKNRKNMLYSQGSVTILTLWWFFALQ